MYMLYALTCNNLQMDIREGTEGISSLSTVTWVCDIELRLYSMAESAVTNVTIFLAMFSFLYYYYFHVYGCFAYIHVSAHACSAARGQERVLDPLELS